MKKIICVILGSLTAILAQAQRSEIFSDNLRTLQLTVNDDWKLPPVMTLGGSNRIEISFDDMTHEYHRYIYKVQHCDANWQPSTEIFETDYLDGFNGNPIDNYAESFNTTVLYTHYLLTIPNDDLRLKLSGNYKLSVYADEAGADTDKPLLTACFSIVEPLMGLSASVTSNTDVDFNASHQQIDFTLTFNNYAVRDPASEIKTVVLQNRRWDNAVRTPKPTYQTSSMLQYTHNRSLIFPAGNEYHKFEILNVHYPTLNVDKIQWFDPYYHATLVADTPSKNYLFDEDQDGSFYIRTDEGTDNVTTSDYVYVHFTLQAEPLPSADVYLNGAFTYDAFTPACRMTYNATTRAYEASMLLKQGYYNYQYLAVSADGGVPETAPFMGNYFQTENEYIVLAYHRPQGERYDKLVAYKRMNFSIQ